MEQVELLTKENALLQQLAMAATATAAATAGSEQTLAATRAAQVEAATAAHPADTPDGDATQSMAPPPKQPHKEQAGRGHRPESRVNAAAAATPSTTSSPSAAVAQGVRQQLRQRQAAAQQQVMAAASEAAAPSKARIAARRARVRPTHCDSVATSSWHRLWHIKIVREDSLCVSRPPSWWWRRCPADR
jgi:hypothetical protein